MKYFYKWSADGTVLYVKKFYKDRTFFGLPITRETTVYTLYTKNFDDVVKEAERMIKIYEAQDK